MMQRPDPMIASKPGAEDTQAMAARTLWLEELFFLDGRDNFVVGKPKRTKQGNGTNSRPKRGKKRYRGQGKR
jgi:hypothetical protein